jgi:hypothetical protein
MTEFLKKITSGDIRNILAVIATLGCFAMLYLLIITPIPGENKDIVLTAVGFVFGGLLSGVGGYYFGASKEKTKDE